MAQVETLLAPFLNLMIKGESENDKSSFFDLDGTLISNTTGEIPKSARKSIDFLRMNGVRVFTATGRHMSEIKDLPAFDIQFDGFITLNGQLCLDSRKELLYGEPISERNVEQMLTMFEARKVPLMLVEKDRMYINYIDEMVEKAQAAINTAVPDIGTYSGEPIYQFILYSEEKTAEKIVAGLEDCKMTRWNPYGVDIISKSGGGKWPESSGSYRLAGFDVMKSWHLEMVKMIWTCSAMQESGSRWEMQRKMSKCVRII